MEGGAVQDKYGPFPPEEVERFLQRRAVYLNLAVGGCRLSSTAKLHCILYRRAKKSKWEKVGRSEKRRTASQVVFAKSFVGEWFPDKQAYFRCDLYFHDAADGTGAGGQGLLASTVFPLSEKGEVPAPIQKFQLCSENTRKEGVLRVYCECLAPMKEFIRNPFQQLQTNEKKVAIMERYFSWQFAVKELKKKGIVRRPDPYYIIKKMVGEIGEVVVFRSKKKRSTLSAQWQAECIAETLLHGGDPHRPIIIEVWDQNIGTDKFIGSVNTSAAELLNERQEFQLINQKQRKKLKDNYTHSGILQVIKVHSEGREKFVMNPFFGRNRFNLLAYLNGGCKVHLHLAVDWTKDPALPPDDPYHLPKERHRRYFEAPLSSIVYALCDLFRETSVAAFCIGGKPKHSKNKPQPPCFALNSCEDKPFVDCHRLSDTYAKALQELRFSNHAPLSSAIATVVEQVKHSIKEQQEGIQAYHVLVIVTWGQPTEQERQRTAKHIVLASNKPLSIVFVGVGTSKLDAMRTLAQYPLVADNKEAARPTVLIVKHKHFEQHGDNSFQQDIAPDYRPLSSPQQQHETAPASTFFKPLTPVGDSYASPHYASPPVFSHQQPPPSPSQPDVVIGQHPPQQMIGWTPSPFVGGEATSSLAWNSPPPQHHSNARLEDEALYSLLQSLGYLEKYGALFARESLTLEALKRFTKQDMQEVLGLPAGPRIAIYNALHPTQ